MACTWHVNQQDTGRRKSQYKNGRRYEVIIWVYDWVASCGVKRGGYTSKGAAASDAIAHCRSCRK